MNDHTSRDGRVFYHLATIPYQRVDGSHTELAVWHSACVVCGKSFTVQTPVRYESSAAFGRKHCEEHKLTKAEVIERLRNGSRAARQKAKAGK